MELAPKGSLRKVLACDHLSRGMQHRIASQVCKAKAFPDYRGTTLIFSIFLGLNPPMSLLSLLGQISAPKFHCS